MLTLSDWVARRAIGRWRIAFGFDALSDPASLPLIVFLLLVFMTAVLPVQMMWARQIEHEADRFCVELSHQNRAAASMVAGFEQSYLESPHPGWFALATRWTHPPSGERIAFFNTYHPWLEGQPLRYGGVCKMPR